jgi:hypothetical protein
MMAAGEAPGAGGCPMGRCRPSRHLWLALCVVVAVGAGCENRGSAVPPTLRLEGIEAMEPAQMSLDEVVRFRFSTTVRAESVDHETIRMRTGPGSGRAPLGTFVRGDFLVDPVTGNVVVIDPDGIPPALLDRVERTGRVDLLPEEIRFDLGYESRNRRVLFDLSQKNVVTFIPEAPTLTDLSDSGFEPGVTYAVQVPTVPEKFTVRSRWGERLRPKKGSNVSTALTTAPADAARVFRGEELSGETKVVSLHPAGGRDLAQGQSIHVRFSAPLDPRTVTHDDVFLVCSVCCAPRIPCSLLLSQTRLGSVEVVVTPLVGIPADGGRVEIIFTPRVHDLRGEPIVAFVQTFISRGTGDVEDVVEIFDTNDMEDEAATTANWNGSKSMPGATPAALTAAAGSGQPATSTAVSRWYEQDYMTPHYGPISVDSDAHGGTIEISVQGVRDDYIDGEFRRGDPEGQHSTAWEEITDIHLLANYRYLRFRVMFELPPGHQDGDPVPTVREIRVPVSATSD